VTLAEPVWDVSGLNTSVYTPVVGRVFWLRTALDPLQELDVATVVPSDFTIDRDKSKQYEENVPFATRAVTTWPARPLNIRRAFCPGVEIDTVRPPRQ
jgi:hypothetical protein